MAGEGCFAITRPTPPRFADGSERKRFLFQVTMASRDRRLLESLRQVLGFGSIQDREPARAGWQPTSVFTIASRKAHLAATIPFMKHHLLPSAKRQQFDSWHDALLAYDAQHPNPALRGRSVCSIEGCSDLVRGRGLCRRHYYRATGY